MAESQTTFLRIGTDAHHVTLYGWRATLTLCTALIGFGTWLAAGLIVLARAL